DGFHDGQIVGAGPEPLDEAPVDLHRVHRQRLEVRQRAVAGAEVVDGDLHAHPLEPAQGDLGAGQILHHHVLGDLQAHRAAVDGVLAQDVLDALDEIEAHQLHRGDVDAHDGVGGQAARPPVG